MFGSIGGFEIIVIAVIGLLVFGPRKLPEIARTLGRTLGELRSAAMEMRTSIERELDVEEVRKATRSATDTIRSEILTGPPLEPAGDDKDKEKDRKDGGGERKI
jgi:Tat protein translocase TatB subunit